MDKFCKMADSGRKMAYGLWIISFLLIILNSCEYKSPEPEIDYSGQKDTLLDIDGNIYKTVGIGSQIWLAENLKVTRFTDGTTIPCIIENKDWKNGFLYTPGYCWYANDSINNKTIYGALYNYFAVEKGSLCPTGWHVPSNNDWKTLAKYLGGTNVAGGKLKESFGNFWNSPNNCFLNKNDFNALPSGYRKFDLGDYFDIGNKGYWWTSTTLSTSDSHVNVFSMSYNNTYLQSNQRYKNEGLSVRCIKD
jgi:uncharacterized protein (TIGR02145 family)